MSGTTVIRETALLWKLALPLVASFLAEYLMFLSTKSIVGKIGFLELASVGIAGDLVFELLVIIMGFLSVAGVVIAQAEGANDKQNAGNSAFQCLLIATVIALPCTVIVWHLDLVMEYTKQEPEVIALATPFLHVIASMIFPILWFAVLRSFVTALSSPSIIMLITVSAVIINYLLTTVLVHGGAGFEAMGIEGAGLSLTLVNWIMFIALAINVYCGKRYTAYRVFRPQLTIDLKIWRDIFKLGLPVAGLVTLEAGLFIAVSVLAGVMGAKELAASQVLMGWVGFPFVVAYGVANATMIRVAHSIGTGHHEIARLAGLSGLLSGSLMLMFMAIVPLGIPDVVVSIFLSADDPGRAPVATLVKQLLMVVAFFQIFDGIQVISSHALRGMRDTIAPLWIAAIGYWVLGIGGGCLMAFQIQWGLPGLWLGLALGLTVTGSLLALRFHLLTSKAQG